ncbi:unnamed protein product [Arctia plantaginis]|uniref:Ig-like domain-containing protein n=1 Tax=Arctia plantaginis TaxID=874455 RepID=A0A8S1AD15_ARCPL|nr:unnamed protein product [Arctia plantaginis]
MVMAYVGAVARLPCSVCAPPDERHILVWMYAELLPVNKTFKPLQHNARAVLEHNHLQIYNVKIEDAGMYRCQIGDSNSLAVLEVVDTDEKYSVVKPSTSRGPYESPPYSLSYDLMMFTSWSPWSECSVCGKVGRRRRYGICFLKLDNRERARRTNDNYNTEENSNISLDNNAIQLFETFPEGIPCRSRFLPSSLREVAAIQQRTSEIMIALCKVWYFYMITTVALMPNFTQTRMGNIIFDWFRGVTCEAIIFKVRSTKGIVLETANNTAGIYSLHQVLPKQPPLPARDTIFASFGDHITIHCPGTTLADVPITWRFGTKAVVPRDIDKASGGRMYINSRDQLVITKVLYRDANVYSCWQRAAQSGAVALHVRRGAARVSSRARALLLALVALAAALLALAHHLGHRPPPTAYAVA